MADIRNHTRGSTWRKWDLHIHTPASFTHGYSGNESTIWDRFLSELESLPPEIKVIGINDYIFIDGYKRIRCEKQRGRLSNIDLILPVVELRLDKFAGTDSHLKRVNFHIVFSDEIKPEIIEQHFLNALPRKYQLSPEVSYLKKQWQAVATKESLTELGELITQSTPESKRSNLPSPLELGFNNLNFDRDSILEVLESHYFQDKYLTAVGKTEWENIRWTQAIADKKDIVNRASFVFTSAKTIEQAIKSKDSLTEQGVNDCLLDCSDAHYFSDSEQHNRIGKCFTWIKADPTFTGLRQLINEPKQRCFIGETPEKSKRVQESPTKYIKSLSIKRTSDLPAHELWFDNINLDFNHGMVAIVGGQGNGKSALADIIALLGDSCRRESFSFLTPDKFCTKKGNRAQYFEATLTWESKDSITKRLDNTIDENVRERVKYIPQNFFDKVCNETELEGGEFERELKEVIFSHVEEVERNNCYSLDDLVRHRTSEVNVCLDTLRGQLCGMNREIIEYERLASNNYEQVLQANLKLKENELETHRKNRPTEVSPVRSDEQAQLELNTLQEQGNESSRKIGEISKQLKEEHNLRTEISCGLEKLDHISLQFDEFRKLWKEQINLLKISVDDLVQIKVNRSLLIDAQSSCNQKIQELTNQKKIYEQEKQEVEDEISKKKSDLNESAKKYQEYLNSLEWHKNQEEVIFEGSSESVKFYKKELDRNELPRRKRTGYQNQNRANCSSLCNFR